MRFRSYTRDIVRLTLGGQAATYYVVNGWCDIPDAACITYRASIEAQIQSGMISPRGKLPWNQEDTSARATPGTSRQATVAAASSSDAIRVSAPAEQKR